MFSLSMHWLFYALSFECFGFSLTHHRAVLPLHLLQEEEVQEETEAKTEEEEAPKPKPRRKKKKGTGKV